MFALHRGAGELRWLLICHNRGQTFSCDPQIRDYTGNRDSGVAAVAQVLDLVAGPKSGAQAKLLVQYPAACNAITFILAQCPHLMHLTTK